MAQKPDFYSKNVFCLKDGTLADEGGGQGGVAIRTRTKKISTSVLNSKTL